VTAGEDAPAYCALRSCPATMPSDDTLPAPVQVFGVERLRGCGALLALADVVLDLDGVEVVLHRGQDQARPTRPAPGRSADLPTTGAVVTGAVATPEASRGCH
jgi:hypothetical protein